VNPYESPEPSDCDYTLMEHLGEVAECCMLLILSVLYVVTAFVTWWVWFPPLATYIIVEWYLGATWEKRRFFPWQSVNAANP
jgi:hypothetical protein